MKKILLLFSVSILTISISLILFLKFNVNSNKKKNEEFLKTYDNLLKQTNLVYEQEFILPKIEMNNRDYIGVINILKEDLLLPVECECNNLFFGIKSVCNYSNKPFIILGTNLKDSFYSYQTYDINDTVMFTNALGNTFQYKIKNIKRINNLNSIDNYTEDLIIIIKNYYSLEYILFICEFD